MLIDVTDYIYNIWEDIDEVQIPAKFEYFIQYIFRVMPI